MKKFITAAIIATFAISSPANAAVTFDAAVGTGFVGKGDVQLAFAWNNAQTTANAAGVSFTYNVQEAYKFDCTFTVEVGRDKVREPRTQNRGTSSAVNATLTREVRKNTQGNITGYILNGFGTTAVTSGSAPVDGGHCVGGQFNDGEISNVELVSSEGGLYVNYGSSSVLIG